MGQVQAKRTPYGSIATLFLLVSPLFLGAVSTVEAAPPANREGVLSTCTSGASSTSSVFPSPGELTDCTISMDNLTVDLGPETEVVPGEPAVLIGEQDGEEVNAEQLAESLGTINYEITCGLSARVPRAFRG